jgi:2-aminoadipate transaminase
MSFDFSSVLPDDLPAPAAAPWSGFPEYNFVGGHNDAASVPVDDLVAAARAVLAREGATLATYGLNSGPQGYEPLRRFVAETLNRNTGMSDDAGNVLMTSGSLQALDLVNQLLVRPGDKVLIEENTYGGALSRLAAIGAEAIGIPLDKDGMRMDVVAAELEKLHGQGIKPKYIYTIPTVQNPSGSVMPDSRRVELLRLAAQYDVPVFEDDCYADLLWDGKRPPAIRALDDSGRVIYCGSFSKSIAPALRVGYIVADWPVIARMLSLKTDAGSGALEQMVLAEYCKGHFDAHVAALAQTLKAKCEVIVEALEEQFGTAAEFTPPRGGIFIWVTLPEQVDTGKLAQIAAAEGVAINPGAEWSTDKVGGKRRLRLCFGHPTAEVIRNGVARLAEICQREFGVPTHSANVARD